MTYRTDDAPADLIAALEIFRKDDRLNKVSPFHCEHDTLTVMADPSEFSEGEIARLENMGFHLGSEYGDLQFHSYRFGSA